ncbi:hypothetical protein ACT3TZ_15010 [Brachybacterium sp. AOP25-B2-12]
MSALRTAGTQLSGRVLGSAVSSRIPIDAQPSAVARLPADPQIGS